MNPRKKLCVECFDKLKNHVQKLTIEIGEFLKMAVISEQKGKMQDSVKIEQKDTSKETQVKTK